MARSDKVDLKGKVIFVTGSTDGIGKHTARLLVRQGATVLLHGRNPVRVADTAAELSKLASSSGGAVSAYTRDLSSLVEVKALAQEVRRDHPQINVLVNNAGVFETEEKRSEDGYELTWAVNVVAPFLLTSLLLDSVTERIINVSSISAGSRIDWDDLQGEKGYSSHSAYSLSKLAMQLYTAELAERLEGRGVVVNALDPGTVNTKMLKAGWGSCGIQLKDANDLYWITTSVKAGESSGAYYVSSRPSNMARLAGDTAARAKLWEILTVQSGAKYTV